MMEKNLQIYYNSDMPRSFKNKKGFTLVELLIVIFLVSVLAVVALSTYTNSTGTFNFLASYKNVMSVIKNARSFAITSKQTDGIVPDNFGVNVTAKKIILFADVGAKPFLFEPPAGVAGVAYDKIITTYDFANTDYQIKVLDSTKVAELAMPVVLYYNKSNANLNVRQKGSTTNDIVPKTTNKFIVLEFSKINTTTKKYIVIFQVSGLPEDYKNLNAI